MKVDIFNQIPVAETYRSNRVRSMMNVSPEDGSTFKREFELPVEGDWRIGAVVGPSGTGKSSIGRSLGALWDHSVWVPGRTIFDQVHARRLDSFGAERILKAVGLDDPDVWLRPYEKLSNGEKFRADLALILADPPQIVVIDEFTSMVDRGLARDVSRSFAHQWRTLAGDQKMVALACHHDILPWLDPDWALDTNTGEIVMGRKAFYDLGRLIHFGRQVGSHGTVVGAFSA